ncbi:MAG TPA: inorganic phosphate transporter [Haliscomenobacter sp.]|uniref:inorganic phosphate transporter n=1 Tax=Haliscomenobacter sp. TaxID=2717303 RepID=UPI001DF9B265|nr:inorganic phosphate transporter [Haliscomenobacter sp.]MBK9488328.1 inorganic phosphate transporter [Haliscomenobacter sp.]HOY15681.1 inorganic phosphate transporter [Haliscomenobacter sp.]HPH21300.1 inorganic phosphate transporter [Haliscomenobacter sp.]
MNSFDLSALSSGGAVMLILFLIAVLAFEFVNGFHDTANAVATVIYTHSLKPTVAVVWSGIWNFLGVITGGVGVAMGIVKLLPVNDMMIMPFFESASIIAAVLLSAIIWNLGTWYYGIPSSSSHTMIGALLGVGIGFYWIHGGDGVNWGKAQEIALALLFSPFFGCFAALFLMWFLSKIIKNKEIFHEPERGKAPPTWIRAILITTCTLVSFFHGSNDGQKGVGLFMIVLMIFLPAQFALHKSFDAEAILTVVNKIEQTTSTAMDSSPRRNEAAQEVMEAAGELRVLLVQTNPDRPAIRKELQKLNKNLKEATNVRSFYKPKDKAEFKAVADQLATNYEFAPRWVIFFISLALGIGTMIGWKRIVVTIGEKIGKTHLTYAQGATAELVASATIAMSTVFHAPVSTTHVLSSAVAGTMIAKNGRKNLQKSTLITILSAWILTLPVTIILSCGLYLLFRTIFG